MEKAKIQSVTTAIILETRKPRKDGLYPVKLRVTFKRDRRYFNMRDQLGQFIVLSGFDFGQVMKANPRETYKDLSLHLRELEQIARRVIESLPVFTFAGFEKEYFEKPVSEQDLFHGLVRYSEDLLKNNRISTGKSFHFTMSALKNFSGKEVIRFEEITVQFLNKFEEWMLKNGKTLTTVGIYLRNVRTIYRKAINAEAVPAILYPFGSANDGKYEIPGGKNIKKALTLNEVGLIANYKVIPGSPEHMYRDYWLFSYLCNGINIKDVARSIYGNIEGETIVVIRAKTERERRQRPRPITIVMTKLIRSIIDQWGNKPAAADQFIFPILTRDMTPMQAYLRTQQTTKTINKYIGRIAQSVGISQKVTTYTARHSFATVLKRSGASMEFVSESLGHSSMITTERYMAQFEIEEKKKWANELTKFPEN